MESTVLTKNHKFTIRTMTRAEVDLAVQWASIEGWNPGLHDAEVFYHTAPDGFFIGELDGEPIGTIACAKYDGNYGFIGFYIIKPDYRGKGYGISLWNHCLETLGNRNIGLNAVPAQMSNYMKSGFRPAFRITRYVGSDGENIDAPDMPIIDLSEVLFEDILTYDTLMFPAARPIFLKHWLNQKDGYTLGVLKNGDLAGYGVLRACHMGYKVGPLFADTPEIADNLLRAFCRKVPEAPVFVDVPLFNNEAVTLVEKYDMIQLATNTRMYTRETPDKNLAKVFGLTSSTLG